MTTQRDDRLSGDATPGWTRCLQRPLVGVDLWRRRTHRVSRGSSVDAGSHELDARTSRATPLTDLEEAVLIAVTGCTGLTMPDRPFADPRNGKPIMAKPNLNMVGRTAGSPDNAQGTHFFMINDTGTYFLRKLPPPTSGRRRCSTPDALLARAAQAKVKLLDRPHRRARRQPRLPRLPRLQPVPVQPARAPRSCSRSSTSRGSTSTAMMYLLTQPEGARPTIVDDRNFYRPAGVKKWVEQRLPEQGHQAAAGQPRGDAHADRGRPAAAEPDADRGRDGPRRLDPRVDRAAGPAGRPEVPQAGTARCSASTGSPRGGSSPTSCAGSIPLPTVRRPPRTTAVGLRTAGEYLIKAMCPPNYPTDGRRGGRGGRRQVRPRRHLHRRGTLRRASTGASSARRTSRRPATTPPTSSPAPATSAPTSTRPTAGSRRTPTRSTCPGVWLQAHHVENAYYEKYFRDGMTEAHELHDQRWHRNGSS